MASLEIEAKKERQPRMSCEKFSPGIYICNVTHKPQKYINIYI